MKPKARIMCISGKFSAYYWNRGQWVRVCKFFLDHAEAAHEARSAGFDLEEFMTGHEKLTRLLDLWANTEAGEVASVEFTRLLDSIAAELDRPRPMVRIEKSELIDGGTYHRARYGEHVVSGWVRDRTALVEGLRTDGFDVEGE